MVGGKLATGTEGQKKLIVLMASGIIDAVSEGLCI